MILPDVIARLVALFEGAVSVPVYDGPKPEATKQPQFVVVGSSGVEGEEGASFEFTSSSLGPGTWLDEAGDIVCSAWSHYGGTDVATRRSEALGLAESCLAAFHADRTLGGLLTVPGAVASGLRHEAVQDATGALVRVSFTVAYQAIVTP